MLTRMQAKYATKPVRFLLFPCNQFAAQEPAPNADVKVFAQQSVTLAKAGAGSNVIMFAKSSLNNVSCDYSAADACTPASAGCCPTNDAIYDYLLSVTAPGKIQWNFDKVIVDKSGKPYAGEIILRGGDLDAELSTVIDKLLAKRDVEDLGEAALPAPRRLAAIQGVMVLSLMTSMAAVLAMAWKRSARVAAGPEISTGYFLVT